MNWDPHRPLAHPGAQPLTAKLVKGLQGENFIERRRRVVFVCGGEIKSGVTNDRTIFLDWAKQHLDGDVFCLLSEEAYRATTIRARQFINLGEFERTLASISDCVLVFPESAGSYGELGIFATDKDIKYKTLVANKSLYQIHSSFLLHGPIHAIEACSQFTPTVAYDKTSASAPPFPEQVWERIKESTHYQSSKRLSNKPFADMPQEDQIATISWILGITGMARYSDLLQIIRLAYKKQGKDSQALRKTLKFMLLLKQLTNPEEDIYQAIQKPDYDLKVKGTVSKLSAQFREFWITEFPELWGY